MSKFKLFFSVIFLTLLTGQIALATDETAEATSKASGPEAVDVTSEAYLKYLKYLSDEEKMGRLKLWDYRVVKIDTTYPKRDDAIYAFKVSSNETGTIATLHQYPSGIAVESCTAPCALHREKKKRYFLSAYKFGYSVNLKVLPHGKKHREKDVNLYMGWNYYAALKEREDCTLQNENITVWNRPLERCYNVVPSMPQKAERSGYCRLEYVVNAAGKAVDVDAVSCSEDMFKDGSIKAVKKWVFLAKVEAGIAVKSEKRESIIEFKLTDEKGSIIPAKE